MVTRTPRLLFALSSLLMAIGGASHAAAFNRTLPAIARSNLTLFFAGSFKLLWLADSATMFILSAIFGFVAARPSAATRPLLILISLIPAATAVLVYVFLGSFFAGHILLATAALAFVAALQFPAVRP